MNDRFHAPVGSSAGTSEVHPPTQAHHIGSSHQGPQHRMETPPRWWVSRSPWFASSGEASRSGCRGSRRASGVGLPPPVSHLNQTVGQAPPRRLPPRLQQAPPSRAHRLRAGHPTRQRLARRHLPTGTRPRLSSPACSEDPGPSMDQDPLALLAQPSAPQPRPTRPAQHPSGEACLT